MHVRSERSKTEVDCLVVFVDRVVEMLEAKVPTSPKCGCRRPIIGSRGFNRRSSTRGMARGLFGRIDLLASH